MSFQLYLITIFILSSSYCISKCTGAKNPNCSKSRGVRSSSKNVSCGKRPMAEPSASDSNSSNHERNQAKKAISCEKINPKTPNAPAKVAMSPDKVVQLIKLSEEAVAPQKSKEKATKSKEGKTPIIMSKECELKEKEKPPATAKSKSAENAAKSKMSSSKTNKSEIARTPINTEKTTSIIGGLGGVGQKGKKTNTLVETADGSVAISLPREKKGYHKDIIAEQEALLSKIMDERSEDQSIRHFDNGLDKRHDPF